MSDGVRLAADLYWPSEANVDSKYPILLEYLPYRKDESRARNYALYSYFLENGYIVARVDIRGKLCLMNTQILNWMMVRK